MQEHRKVFPLAVALSVRCDISESWAEALKRGITHLRQGSAGGLVVAYLATGARAEHLVGGLPEGDVTRQGDPCAGRRSRRAGLPGHCRLDLIDSCEVLLIVANSPLAKADAEFVKYASTIGRSVVVIDGKTGRLEGALPDIHTASADWMTEIFQAVHLEPDASKNKRPA
jgi:hypothetical protein